jgi:hypothetical protein
MLTINNYENIVGWKISDNHRMLTATHIDFVHNPEPKMIGELRGIKWVYIIKLKLKYVTDTKDINVSIFPMGSKEVPFINIWYSDSSKTPHSIAFKLESMDYLQSPNTLLTYILKKLPE